MVSGQAAIYPQQLQFEGGDSGLRQLLFSDQCWKFVHVERGSGNTNPGDFEDFEILKRAARKKLIWARKGKKPEKLGKRK